MTCRMFNDRHCNPSSKSACHHWRQESKKKKNRFDIMNKTALVTRRLFVRLDDSIIEVMSHINLKRQFQVRFFLMAHHSRF